MNQEEREVMQAALDALRMPCDRWNKVQYLKVSEAIKLLEDTLVQPEQAEQYFVEWDGDCYRSVFPSSESELAQLHTTVEDALEYFAEVKPGVLVKVLNHP